MSQEDPTREERVLVAQLLVKALSSTFEIQTSTPITIAKMEAIRPTPIPDVVLLTSIGMKSSKLQGVAALHFPKKTFLGLVNRMLAESYTEVTDENADAASELMNILYGSARALINQEGHDFLPGIPTVIRGSDVVLMHGGVPFIARVTCNCEFGPFVLEMSLKGV